MKKVTMKDIAQEAGVSTATVSHVLNGTAPISEETKKRVLAIVEKSNYEPNVAARNLRRRSAKTIGLIANTIMSDLVPDMIGGANQCAVDRGYTLIIGEARQKVEDQEFHQWLIKGHQVGGLLFCNNSVKEVDYSVPPEFPAMYLYCYSKSRPLDYVLPDSIRGGYTATRHLVDMGRTRLAYIGGTLGWKCTTDRLAGFKLALDEAGIDYYPELVAYGNWRADGGYSAARKLLEGADPPDGIFVANDAMAVGVIDLLKEKGLQVPEQVSIVGYDDIPAASLTRPALTTVKLPNYEMGYAACNSLIDRIENKSSSSSWFMFECQLIIRDSCGYHST